MPGRGRIGATDLANLAAAVSRIQSTIDRLAMSDSNDASGALAQPGASNSRSGLADGKYGLRLAKALDLKRQSDLRTRMFADRLSLIGDPIWNLLLELFVAQSRREFVSISAASSLMSIPMTTALRYITYCEKNNFVERQDDPFDRRRCFLTLTPDGDEIICAYLDAI